MQEENDDLEWEEWNPSEISFGKHMIAGSIAGLVEHVTIYPIDTIKTHIQYERSATFQPLHTWENAKAFMQKDGFFRLWRGVSAMFAGCIPAHSAYFTVFEASKKAFGADKEGHHPIQAAACGSLAAVTHDMFMTPFDVVKQRMQLGYYKNVMHCIRTVLKTEGLPALYMSFPTTLMMNIPFGAVMMAVNESMKKTLNPEGQFSTAVSMASGSLAGAIAAAATNPLDVIKTRLQTQNLEHCTKSCEDPHFNFPATGTTGPAPAGGGVDGAHPGPTARKHVPKPPGAGAGAGVGAGPQEGTGGGYPRAKYRKGAGVWVGNSSSGSNGGLRPSYFSPQPVGMKLSSEALSIKQSCGAASTCYRSHQHGLSRRLLGSVSFGNRKAGGVQPQAVPNVRMRALMTKAFSSLPHFPSSSGGSGSGLRQQLSRQMAVVKAGAPAPSTPAAAASVAEAVTSRPATVGMVQMAKRIYAEEGLRGFARGIVPRMLVHAPSVAISWTAYEAMKALLKDSAYL